MRCTVRRTRCAVRWTLTLGDKMNTHAFIIGYVLISTASLASMVNVESYSDGSGIFSYTFSRGDENLFYDLGADGGGGISLRIEGLISVSCPSDWSYEYETGLKDGRIHFKANVSSWILDTNTISISISSVLTNSIKYSANPSITYYPIYTLPYSMGVIGGKAVDSDHNIITGEAEYFSIIGPSAMPQPSSSSLVLTASSMNNVFPRLSISNGATNFPVYILRTTNLIDPNWKYVTHFFTSTTNWTDLSATDRWTTLYYKMMQWITAQQAVAGYRRQSAPPAWTVTLAIRNITRKILWAIK